MSNKGWSVARKPKFRIALGLRKPDIIASRNSVKVTVDAQVVSNPSMSLIVKNVTNTGITWSSSRRSLIY